jgi:hypothetical protein
MDTAAPNESRGEEASETKEKSGPHGQQPIEGLYFLLEALDGSLSFLLSQALAMVLNADVLKCRVKSAVVDDFC